MNQLNNDGFCDLAHLDQIEDGSESEGEDVWILKATILDLRKWNCNKLADLLAEELQEPANQRKARRANWRNNYKSNFLKFFLVVYMFCFIILL